MTIFEQSLRLIEEAPAADAIVACPGYSPEALLDLADADGLPGLVIPLCHEETGDIVRGQIVPQLERAICALFPAWLPGAEAIDTPGGGGREAIGVLARDAAATTDLFGLYLSPIADAALQDAPEQIAARFPPQTALREGHKLFCRAYGVDQAVLIIDMGEDAPDAFASAAEQASLFVAAQRGFRIWITGADLHRLERIPVAPPLRGDAPRPGAPRGALRLPLLTPLSGQPNPMSDTETRLEAHLARCDWAAGRAWNATWASDVLANPVRLDLVWWEAKLVVELDGHDHLAPEKYVSDRIRDRGLQMAGFRVIRFTNDEVADDIPRVASEIERFLTAVRTSAN